MHIKRSLNLSSVSNSPSTLLPIIITAILLVTSLVSAALLQNSPSAHALTPPDSCFAFNAGTGTITNYYNHEGNNSANPACPKAVDIPSTIGGVPVTIIGNASYPGAFTSKNLTSVTIPNSVTSIGNHAFRNNQLTSLTIPSSVTSIGSYAFYSNQLTNLTTPNSVTSIGDSAFSYNQLTSLTIPSSVTSIGNSAFSDNQLTSLTIPSSVTSIGDYAFTRNQLTNLTIPSSVTSIGNFAFSDNQLTNLTTPNSVTSIGYSAFSNNQLTSLTIPSSVTSISDYAFSYNQLTSLTIPNSVTSIGDRAFRNNQLTSLTIPNSVTNIGRGAFYRNKLTALTLPDSVTSLGNYAFEANQLTSVTLGCGLSAIVPEAFAINKLTDVTIPDCITSVDPTAFFGQNPWGGIVEDGSDPAQDWWSSDPAVLKTVFDNIWYARLHTANPSNPNGLKDGITDEAWYTGDINNDGDNKDSLGGHLINPSSATSYYRDGTGSDLAPSQSLAGRLSDNVDLTDYLIKNVQTPDFADSQNPTLEEQAALDNALSAYYRLGDQLTLTPPTISGYLTPQPHNLTLSQATTNHTFTYKPIITEVPFKDNQSVDEGEVITNTTPPPSIAHPIITNSKLSLPTDSTCQTISNAKLMSPTTIQDNENSNNNSNNQTNTIPSDITLLGGLDFTLDHCQVGGATDIAYTLGQEIDDTTSLRVYKHNPAQTNPDLQIQDITNLVNFNTSQDGYTTITYNLTDGGELDQDGQVNGTIVDPIYIGMLASASGEPDGGGEVVGPGATGSGPESGDKGLASTGDSPWLLLSASSVMMVLGLVTITLAHKHRN